jgi:hypothetical protein
MNKFLFVLVYLLFVLRIFAECEINPFPPFPPSPPEFRQALSVRETSEGVLLSWRGVPHQEGYIVSVCSGAEGYKPVAMNVETTSLLVTDIEAPGTYRFQVKAYVQVSGNLIFNGGVLGTLTKSSKTDNKGNTQIAQNDPPEVARSQRVPLSNVENLAVSFPSFDGSRSFYSSEYPKVTNPLSPSQAEDGSVVPALLTDQGIEETVARIYKRTQPVQVASAKIIANPIANIGSDQGSSRGNVSRAKAQDTPSLDTGTAVNSKQTKPKLNEAGASQQVNPEPQQVLPATKVPGGAEPITKQINQGLYVLIGVIILGVIYMIFHKESK